MAVTSSSAPATTAASRGSRILTGTLVLVGVLALVACAMLLSYHGLLQLAVRGNVGEPHAHAYPVLFTVLVLLSFGASYVLRDAPLRTRILADLAVLLLLAVGAAASAVHTLELPISEQNLTLVVTAVPWAAVGLGFYLAVAVGSHLRAQRRSPTPQTRQAPDATGGSASTPSAAPPLRGFVRDATTEDSSGTEATAAPRASAGKQNPADLDESQQSQEDGTSREATSGSEPEPSSGSPDRETGLGLTPTVGAAADTPPATADTADPPARGDSTDSGDSGDSGDSTATDAPERDSSPEDRPEQTTRPGPEPDDHEPRADATVGHAAPTEQAAPGDQLQDHAEHTPTAEDNEPQPTDGTAPDEDTSPSVRARPRLEAPATLPQRTPGKSAFPRRSPGPRSAAPDPPADRDTSTVQRDEGFVPEDQVDDPATDEDLAPVAGSPDDIPRPDAAGERHNTTSAIPRRAVITRPGNRHSRESPSGPGTAPPSGRVRSGPVPPDDD
ncbi:hypothetical protein RIF23_07990 [Lipingzhangella sp. LS1_29]|uniref:DUF2637 domain-containing protein n=1 Tax=Lipingzhangella rawalii TaxID=2055835 RepID=A0ABU2H4K5_9ACTN|nr:hypothetical protein [Lipingzhangella rawalii]MDS1270232.1 hypothetical protein [Lipingzhangella rawalii]